MNFIRDQKLRKLTAFMWILSALILVAAVVIYISKSHSTPPPAPVDESFGKLIDERFPPV